MYIVGSLEGFNCLLFMRREVNLGSEHRCPKMLLQQLSLECNATHRALSRTTRSMKDPSGTRVRRVSKEREKTPVTRKRSK